MGPLLFVLVVLVALPVAILWFGERLTGLRRRMTGATRNIEQERVDWQERLRATDWNRYEQALGRPVPALLRALFEDTALIQREQIEYSSDVLIARFLPIDGQSIDEAHAWLGFQAAPIAVSDAGDILYLRPGPDEPDRVLITHHDGGDTEIVADDLAAFVGKVRRLLPRG